MMQPSSPGDLLQAVRRYGPAEGAQKLMSREFAGAMEAVRTGTYVVWRLEGRREKPDGDSECARVTQSSRCFCGHPFFSHDTKHPTRASCTSCGCRHYSFIPSRPEEVGEYWLPRRPGFDVNTWRVKCRCGHTHEEHDPNQFRCHACGCSRFTSSCLCVGCDGKIEDHATIFESEEERSSLGRPVGRAFLPLSSEPELQQAVFGDALLASPPTTLTYSAGRAKVGGVGLEREALRGIRQQARAMREEVKSKEEKEEPYVATFHGGAGASGSSNQYTLVLGGPSWSRPPGRGGAPRPSGRRSRGRGRGGPTTAK